MTLEVNYIRGSSVFGLLLRLLLSFFSFFLVGGGCWAENLDGFEASFVFMALFLENLQQLGTVQSTWSCFFASPFLFLFLGNRLCHGHYFNCAKLLPSLV
jgi:hypothetical protein